MKLTKLLKRTGWIISIIFILMNFIAFFHAYKFTHFEDQNIPRTKDAKSLSGIDKMKTLFFGINNPRPTNTLVPTQAFETIKLQSNKIIECWNIRTDGAKGTVILFHGYSGQKSSMLDKSDEFIRQGYNTLLVDFMGSGGSEGNQTTLGFKEAEQVKTCYEYVITKGEKKIFLFGTSLGAVAILKAISDYSIDPDGIIIECPFGSIYHATCARFKLMNVPSFPMAGLLVFWAGIQNGFWAFGHKPIQYAKRVKCPTLLLYGEQDEKVSRREIDQIYSNLSGRKFFKSYPAAGHENYLAKYKQEWVKDISSFMEAIGK